MQKQEFQSGNTTSVVDQMVRSAISELDQIVVNATQYSSISQQESVDARSFGTHISEAVRILRGQKG